jgi:hypothetical protein
MFWQWVARANARFVACHYKAAKLNTAAKSGNLEDVKTPFSAVGPARLATRFIGKTEYRAAVLHGVHERRPGSQNNQTFLTLIETLSSEPAAFQ